MIPGYELAEEIGRGGMGVVYRAVSPEGEAVAIKVLSKLTKSSLARFQREAEALANFRHPNIVRLRAVGALGDSPYLVMDYVPGETLRERVARAGPLPEAEVLELGVALANVLERLHAFGLLHRDVKPDNVILSHGIPVLTDFGVVRALGESTRELSRTGAFVGTPGFAPLEQAFGRKHQYGPATDVYGLGATLYFLATGARPHEAEDLQDLVARMSRLPRPPSSLRPGLSAGFDAICLRCLEPEVAERFPSAAELEADLERLRGGQRTQSASRAERALPAQGGRKALALGALLGIGGLVALASVVGPTRSAPSPTASPQATRATPTATRAPQRWAPVEEAIRRKRYTEALDLLDLATNAPAALVWEAALPPLELAVSRLGEANSVGVSERLISDCEALLKRPALELALAQEVGPGAARPSAERRDALARQLFAQFQAWVEDADRRGAVASDAEEAVQRRKLLLARLRVSAELTYAQAEAYLRAAPVLSRMPLERREHALQVYLVLSELAPREQRIQTELTMQAALYSRESSGRFLPILERALAIGPVLERRAPFEHVACRILVTANARDPRLDAFLERRLRAATQHTAQERAELYLFQGDMLVVRGDLRGALKSAEAGARLQPSRPTWRAWCAAITFELGERDLAAKQAETLLASLDLEHAKSDFLTGRHEAFLAADICVRVIWSVRRGSHPQEARDAIRRAATAQRRDAEAWRWWLALAWLELETGAAQAADRALEQALSSFRARVYKDAGSRAQADDYLRQLEALLRQLREQPGPAVADALEGLVAEALTLGPFSWVAPDGLRAQR